MKAADVHATKVYARAGQEPHRALDVHRRVDKVANDAHCLIVYAGIMRPQHLDQCWQRSKVYYLVLVLLVFEGQSAECTSSSSLYL